MTGRFTVGRLRADLRARGVAAGKTHLVVDNEARPVGDAWGDDVSAARIALCDNGGQAIFHTVGEARQFAAIRNGQADAGTVPSWEQLQSAKWDLSDSIRHGLFELDGVAP